MSLFTLIPARGGSRRIPRKNLERIRGVTLVGRAIGCAQSDPWVSTEDDEIAAEARSWKAHVHPRRRELASDDATMDELARDFVDFVEAVDGDLLCILEPSAPLRRPSDVRAACDLLKHSKEADGVRTVSRVERPQLFNHTIVDGGYLEPLVPKAYRGAYPQLFRDNGIANVVRVGVLRSGGFLFTERTLALVIGDTARGIDVDEPADLEEARRLAALA